MPSGPRRLENACVTAGARSRVDEVLRLHSADARYTAIAGLSICRECGKQWPCPTVQVAAEPAGGSAG